VCAITSITQTEETAEEVDDEITSWEETSWEDAQFNAAVLGFTPANYDSSYDSQSSMCASDRIAEEMASLSLPDAIVARSDAIVARPEIRPAVVPACGPIGVTAAPTASVSKVEESPVKTKTTTQEAVGLEFAAGVHLIEEMENQVMQWEESEDSRQQAYEAFVQSQMLLRAQQRHSQSRR